VGWLWAKIDPGKIFSAAGHAISAEWTFFLGVFFVFLFFFLFLFLRRTQKTHQSTATFWPNLPSHGWIWEEVSQLVTWKSFGPGCGNNLATSEWLAERKLSYFKQGRYCPLSGHTHVSGVIFQAAMTIAKTPTLPLADTDRTPLSPKSNPKRA